MENFHIWEPGWRLVTSIGAALLLSLLFHEAERDFLSGTTMVSVSASRRRFWKQGPLSLSKHNAGLCAGCGKKNKGYLKCALSDQGIVFFACVIIIADSVESSWEGDVGCTAKMAAPEKTIDLFKCSVLLNWKHILLVVSEMILGLSWANRKRSTGLP